MAAKDDEMFQSFFVKSHENQKSLRTKISTIHKEKQELEVKINEINKTLQTTSEEKKKLFADLEMERELAAQTRHQFDELNKRLKDIETQLDSERNEKEKLTKENSKKTSLIKRLENVSTVRKTEIENLTKEISTLNAEKRRMKKRVETLESDMEIKIKLEKDLQSRIDQLETKYDAINVTGLNHASDEIETLERKLDTAERRNRELSNSVDTLRDSNKFYVEENAVLKEQLMQKETQCNDSTKERDEVLLKLQNLEKENVQFAGHVESILLQLDEHKATVKKAKEDHQKFEDEINVLKKSLDDQQSLEQYRKAHEDQTKIIESKVRLREAKIQILQDKLEEAEKKSLEILKDEKINELSTENQNLLEENLKQMLKIEQLNAKIKESELLQTELEKTKNSHSKLEKEIETKELQVKELMLEVDRALNLKSDYGSSTKRPRLSDDILKISELETKLKEVVDARDRMLEENIKQMDHIEHLSMQLTKDLMKN